MSLTETVSEAGVIKELFGTGSGQQVGVSIDVKKPALGRVQQLPGGVLELLGCQTLIGWVEREPPLSGSAGGQRLVRLQFCLQLDGSSLPLVHLCLLTGPGQENRCGPQ